MRMRWPERWLLNTPLRGLLLRKVEVPRVLAGLELPPGAACIEIGCGSGVGALELSRRLRPRRMVCVDSDPRMIERARRRLARPPRWADASAATVEPVRADATELPMPAAGFDAAFLLGVLHHIRRWPAAIAEVFRVLAPGGAFAFEEALLGPSPLLANRFWRHVPFGRGELVAELSAAGFRIERFDTALAARWCFVRARKPSGPVGQ